MSRPIGDNPVVWAPVDRVSPFMLELLGCLCRSLARAGRPVCRCALYHGQSNPPMDDCDCTCVVEYDGVELQAQGQAWARLTGTRTSNTFGNTGGTGFGNPCNVYPLQAEVEIGVYRCVSTPEDDGTPPSGEDQTNDALDAYADLNVLHNVVGCCDVMVDNEIGFIINGWRPIGPAGGCAGSALTFTMEVPNQRLKPPRPNPPGAPELSWIAVNKPNRPGQSLLTWQ